MPDWTAQLNTWRQDPQFNALPDSDRQKIYSNWFLENMTDSEFDLLGDDLKAKAVSNFVNYHLREDRVRAVEAPAHVPNEQPAPVESGKSTEPGFFQDAWRSTKNIGRVYPVLENAANIVSQGWAVPAGTLAGFADYALRGDAEKALETGERVHGALAYNPQTAAGQEVAGDLAWPFRKMAELGHGASEKTFEATGSPGLATAVGTIIEGAPYIGMGVAGLYRGMAPRYREAKWNRAAGPVKAEISNYMRRVFGLDEDTAADISRRAVKMGRTKKNGIDMDIVMDHVEGMIHEDPIAYETATATLNSRARATAGAEPKRPQPGPQTGPASTYFGPALEDYPANFTMAGEHNRFSPEFAQQLKDQPKRLPAGQGFELRPKTVRRPAPNPEAVYMTEGSEPGMPTVEHRRRNNAMWPTLTGAQRAASKLLKAGVEVVPVRAESGQWTLERKAGSGSDELARQVATEMIESDPVYAIMSDIMDRGGIKTSSFSKDYGKDTIRSLNRKRRGLVRLDGQVAIDQIAEEYGMDSDDLVNAMLDIETKAEAQRRYYAQYSEPSAMEQPSESAEVFQFPWERPSAADTAPSAETKGNAPTLPAITGLKPPSALAKSKTRWAPYAPDRIANTVRREADEMFSGLLERVMEEQGGLSFGPQYEEAMRAWHDYQEQEKIRRQEWLEKEKADRGAGAATETPEQAAGQVPTEDDDITYLYAGVPIPEMVRWAKKQLGRFKGIDSDDISLWERATGIPDWIAQRNPDFAPIRDVQRDRDLNRNAIRHSYLTELEPALKLKKGSPSWKKVGAVLWKGDALKSELNPAALNAKFTPEERAAYSAVRSVLNEIWHEDMPELMRGLGETDVDIEKYRRSVGRVKGYMPHPRRGRWHAKIVDTATEDVLWREHFDDIVGTMTGGKVLLKKPEISAKLGKMFPKMDVIFGENKRAPEDMFFSVSPQITQELVDLALETTPGDAKTKAAFGRALEHAIADLFKTRGFMAHGIERKGTPGFDSSNWQDAVVEYISGWAGFKSKLLAAQEIRRRWPKAKWQGKENLRSYADKYVRDSFTNADKFDRAMDRARAYMFFQFLGGVVKSAALNLTQTEIAVVPRLMVETKWAGMKARAEMLKALKDVLASVKTPAEAGMTKIQTARKGRLSDDEQWGLSRARINGVVSDLQTQELMGATLGKFGTATRKVSKAMGFFFGAAESFNRETTWLAAFRIATKEKQMPREAAADWADRIVEETHFNYGKSNLPPFVRGQFGRFARPFYAFRSYTDNLVRGLWDSLIRRHGKKGALALGRSILAMMFLGGMSGIPLFKTLSALITKATGKDIRSEVAELAGDYADLMLYGAPSLIGVDMTGSISIEAPMDVSDIAGVPAQWAKRTGSMVEDLRTGDVARAVEDFPLMPQVISLPMAARRMYSRGQQTRGGKVLHNDAGQPTKIGPGQAVGKALGFQPVEISEGFRKFDSRNRIQQYWQDKKDRLSATLALSWTNNGSKSPKTKAAREEIKAFNKARPPFIAPISVMDVLKNRTRYHPSKRERLLKRDVK